MKNKVSDVLARYVELKPQEQRQFVFELADHILAKPLRREMLSGAEQIENPLRAGASFGPQRFTQVPGRIH